MADYPPEFQDAFEALQERLGWADRALEDGPQVAQAKALREYCLEFLERWRPRIQTREMQVFFDQLEAALVRKLTRVIEIQYLQELQAVILSRMQWSGEERQFRLGLAILKTRRQIPPELRGSIDEELRGPDDQAFDPVGAYRRAEARLDAAETAFRRALAALAGDWPEKVDANLRARLEGLQEPEVAAWHQEIAAQRSILETAGNPPPASH